MLRIRNNPTFKGLSRLVPGVVYSTATGVDLTMDLIVPQTAPDAATQFPLIVFIQGSAYTFPDVNYEIPQLSYLASHGFVVATITHRNREDGHPAPAFLIDCKCAVRFLRAHAAEYHIDAKRVYAFGTSSGGTAATLLALTGDMECFRSAEYSEYSDAVCAMVNCFGPTDTNYLLSIQQTEQARTYHQEVCSSLCGGVYDQALIDLVNPMTYIQAQTTFVPMLYLQGDKDELIDYRVNARTVRLLEEKGADVSFVCVEGADHEGDFWSLHVLDLILHFLLKQAEQ